MQGSRGSFGGVFFIISLVLNGASASAAKFDDDVPAPIQNQMKQDLDMMFKIEGSDASKIHTRVFGAVAGAQYDSFFNSRVEEIGLNDCGSANAVACVIPWSGSNKMWITQNYIKFSHPQIARNMVIFHEARHTESQNGNWPHARCPTPFKDENGKDYHSIWTGASLAGEPACDKHENGSYGTSVILLKNVQKFCSNCSEKVKMDAGIYGDDQFNRLINRESRNRVRADLGMGNNS